MKLIDAHMHFPMHLSSPFDAFVHQVKEASLSRFVLILNTKEEKLLFDKYRNKLDALCIPYSLVFLIKPGNNSDIQDFVKLNEYGITSNIKLHPRISDIRSEHFDLTAKTIEKCPADVVVVDCFAYGHKTQNHIGIELAVYLADKFPEKKFILAHAGGVDILKTSLFTGLLKGNTFFDLSFTCNYFVGSSVQLDIAHFLKHNSNRTMFGSDYPAFTSNDALTITMEFITQVHLNQEQQDAVLYSNARKIYWNEV